MDKDKLMFELLRIAVGSVQDHGWIGISNRETMKEVLKHYPNLTKLTEDTFENRWVQHNEVERMKSDLHGFIKGLEGEKHGK